MYRSNKLYEAITMAVASGAVGVSGSALAQDDAPRRLEEVIVTASKRAENLQDVPISVQSMDAAMLEERDINSFEDWVNNAPSVNFSGRGPGQNSMFIRGVAGNPSDIRRSGGLSSSPAVALYLDDAPFISNGRNMDLYITDMQRIEVLPGPQGTLYGASSQSGTVRLVTNKPVLNEFEGNIQFSGHTINKGGAGWGLEGAVNIPVIEDRLAVRAVAYEAHNGGWIDNVPGTTSYADSEFFQDGTFTLANDVVLPERDNANQVEDDFNTSRYRGGRLTGMLRINEDWDLTAGVVAQNLHAEGVFDFLPREGDLNVVRFNSDKLKDEILQFNWNLEGRLGLLDVVYNGSYLEQEITQNSDYSINHENVIWMPYYNCAYNGAGEVQECAAPDALFLPREENQYMHHELRFSTDASKPLRFLGGVWYSDQENQLLNSWTYHAPEVAGFVPNAPFPNTTLGLAEPGPQDPSIAWFHTIVDQSEELAFFGEVSYDITQDLTATFGARWFDIDINALGSFNPAPKTEAQQDIGGSLDAIPPANASDVIFKGNLTYRVTDDIMVYGTFSEGFRRGRFNRQGAVFDPNTGEQVFPAFVDSDSIDNYEIGWKTQLFDDRLRLNGAVYYIEWSGMHFTSSIPGSNIATTANAGDAEILGLEADFNALLSDNLTVSGAVSINDTELVSVREGTEQFVVPVGSELSLTPTFQGNLNFRYDFLLNGIESYATFGIQHKGSAFTNLDPFGREPLDAYTMFDASVGMNLGQWRASLRASNLTDARPEFYKSSIQGPTRITSARPRTLSFRVGYSF